MIRIYENKYLISNELTIKLLFLLSLNHFLLKYFTINYSS